MHGGKGQGSSFPWQVTGGSGVDVQHSYCQGQLTSGHDFGQRSPVL